MTGLIEVQLGKTKTQFIDGDRSSRYPKREEFVEQGVLFLNSESIKSGSIDKAAANHITERKYADIKKGRIQRGDILLTTRGNGVGDAAYVNITDAGLINAQMLILRTDENEVCSKFLLYYLSSKTLYSYIWNFASGSAQPQIPIRDLKKIPIFLPEIKVQDKIAAILSAYDDLIENNKRRIALLENMAEEIYREWFVRFRFPNYKNAEFEKGIPKGWELVTLDKAFKCLGGGTPSKESNAYWKEGDINWYTPSDITGAEGFFLSSSKDKCNEEGLARSSAKMFPAYSIMMTSRATIGAIGINTTPACTNQGFITCIPNKKYPLTYLYYWFKLSKSHFVMLSGGATFPELSKTTFKRIEILTPSHEIIDEFDKIVKPIFEQVEKLLAMNESLKQSKNSLLPRLISGKLTVENLNIQFPPSMEM